MGLLECHVSRFLWAGVSTSLGVKGGASESVMLLLFSGSPCGTSVTPSAFSAVKIREGRAVYLSCRVSLQGKTSQCKPGVVYCLYYYEVACDLPSPTRGFG